MELLLIEQNGWMDGWLIDSGNRWKEGGRWDGVYLSGTVWILTLLPLTSSFSFVGPDWWSAGCQPVLFHSSKHLLVLFSNTHLSASFDMCLTLYDIISSERCSFCGCDDSSSLTYTWVHLQLDMTTLGAIANWHNMPWFGFLPTFAY